MNASHRTIGPYRVGEVLGEGGMGTVFAAHQTEPLQRTVALKVLKPTEEPGRVLERYEAERQALAALNHPSIARVFDAGLTPEGEPYVVMELVEGESILRYCDAHRLTIRERLEIFTTVCRAVQHAHSKGVIHRDLKPEHILVSEVEGMPLPKIIDFGIAVAAGRDHMTKTRLGDSQSVVGTPAYMSPEQIDGSEDIDTRSDIYSLGVVLYELLVGAAPFDLPIQPGWGAFAAQVMSDPPTPTERLRSLDETQETVADLRGTTPRQLNRELHDDLDWIVIRALARHRDERYPTAHELALELERHLAHEPVHAHPATTLYYARKFARRHRAAVALSMLVGVIVVAFGITSYVQNIRITAARAEADARRAQAESLLDFVLNDLRERLTSIGRLDLLDEVGDRALAYFAQVSPDSWSDAELASRAQALYQIGSVRVEQGRLPDARRAFEESLRLARALSARDPLDNEWLFELGQAEFHVGNVARLEGDLNAALGHFSTYRDAADELLRREPSNTTFLLEAGYGHTNVGTIHHERGELAGAFDAFTASLDLKQRAARAEPGDARRAYDVGQGHNLLGVLLQDMGRLDEARAHFEADVEIKIGLVRDDPENATFAYRLAVAHGFLAEILHATGDLEGALENFRAERDLLLPLVEADPANLRWARNLSAAETREAHALLDAGMPEIAERRARSSAERQRTLVVLNPDQIGWTADLAAARRQLGRVLLERGRGTEARTEADGAVSTARTLVVEDPDAWRYVTELAQAEILLADVLEASGGGTDAAALYRTAADRLEPLADGSTNTELLSARATALWRLGRSSEASATLTVLDGMGYRPPELASLRARSPGDPR